MSNHASVRVAGYTVPLIGLPVSATECECDLCHDVFHVQDLTLNEAGNQFLCPKHREPSKLKVFGKGSEDQKALNPSKVALNTRSLALRLDMGRFD